MEDSNGQGELNYIAAPKPRRRQPHADLPG